MTPRELRRAMRQRTRELRREAKALRRQLRAKVEQLPEVRRAKRRRRARRALLIALLLLVALLTRCECQPEPAPPPPAPPPKVEPEVKEPEPKKKPPARPAKARPVTLKTEAQPRGNYAGEARPAPSWLDDFHLQVSARSRRLAQCFEGANRPGALRWTTTVSPESGAVSDHELEPVAPAPDLRREQRECLVKALSNPGYRLPGAPGQAVPGRISLVIEF